MVIQAQTYWRMHPCSSGLSDEAIDDIASRTEVIHCDTGDYVHHAHDPLASVYFVVQGRLHQAMVDKQNQVMISREITRGFQFGLLGAAQGEPFPVNVIAREPSTLLKLEYGATRELGHKHPVFGANLVAVLTENVRDLILPKKRPRRPRIVVVIHQSPQSHVVTQIVATRLAEMGETLVCLSNVVPRAEIPQCSWQPIPAHSGSWSEDEILKTIHRLPDPDRVLIDVDATANDESIRSLLEIGGKILWCRGPEDWPSAKDRLQSIGTARMGWHAKLKLVWLLENAQQVRPEAPGVNELVSGELKTNLSNGSVPQGSQLGQGMERIVHELRDVHVGLALGGGAARGMAHLGVLKTLERSGIVIDTIAGTSAGAMVGTLYASGFDVDYLTERFMKELRPPWWFRMLPRGRLWYLLYLYRRHRFESLLRKYLGDWQLEQFPIPMHTVTVDLVEGESVVRERGDAAHAIIESINLPVLSTPVCRGGRALVDGGLINNVPADVLVARGCNFVIAVSVTASLEKEFARNRPDTPTGQMRSAGTLQTVLRCHVVQSKSMNAIGVEPADVVIQPDTTQFDLTEFDRADELAAVGEHTALGDISRIKESLTLLDDRIVARSTSE